ncbi:LysR family transcriptional regulator [Shewanella japonica]|uniref:LysR family transcriptional regulator n=1 Tax=Shewanella japonica TaxID=93973 RepID=A0ABM6JR13_9GAMM|nr:LysR family transcriptional regulator [Shewanella japonica]ARD23919.1 LysR family transcriptional regulator [Shewanella japonica]
MHINDLELFIAVAKLGSFSKAAESLDTRRALVSRRIADLEKHLGAPLFIRTTRAMSLTPNGEQFLEQVEPLVNQLRNAAHVMRNDQAEVQGRVRIGLIPFTDRLLDKYIAEFVTKYPNVQLDIFMVNGGYKELARLGLDFVLDTGTLDDSGFIAKKLGTLNLKLFASPLYIDKAADIHDVTDLEHHSFIGSRSINGMVDTKLKMGDQTIEVKYNIITNELNSLYSFCLAGAGISMLPYSIAAEAIASGKLVSVLPEIESTPIDTFLVYPSRKHMTAAAKLFADTIVDMATSLIETETGYYKDAKNDTKTELKKA